MTWIRSPLPLSVAALVWLAGANAVAGTTSLSETVRSVGAPDAARSSEPHQRTLAAKKKHKRHPKDPATTTDDAGSSGSTSSDAKPSGAGDETPAATDSDSTKSSDKSSARSDEASGTPAASDTEKKTSSTADADAQVSAKASPTDDEMHVRPEAVAVAFGPRVMSRSLTYKQDIYQRNQQYSVPGAPAVALAADIYPGALLGADGVAANLGLTAELNYLLPVVSTSPPSGPGSYAARSLSWSVGAKLRLPLGLFVAGSYGDQKFEVSSTGGATGINIPTTDYKLVRGDAGIRYFASSQVALMASAGFVHCLSLGAMGETGNYPKATGNAFEAAVSLGYFLTQGFEIRGGIDVRRYGLAFHQSASDPDLANALTDPTKKVAGGAVDQYLAGWVALAVILDGEPKHAGKKKTHASRASAAPSVEEPPAE